MTSKLFSWFSMVLAIQYLPELWHWSCMDPVFFHLLKTSVPVCRGTWTLNLVFSFSRGVGHEVSLGHLFLDEKHLQKIKMSHLQFWFLTISLHSSNMASITDTKNPTSKRKKTGFELCLGVKVSCFCDENCWSYELFKVLTYFWNTLYTV